MIPRRYINAVDAITKAYTNDTLQFRNDCGCAVGHLIAHNMGIGVILDEDGKAVWDHRTPVWSEVFLCGVDLAPIDSVLGAPEQIMSTGYTIDELKRIEWAFETTIDSSYDFNTAERFYQQECLWAGMMLALEEVRAIEDVDEDVHMEYVLLCLDINEEVKNEKEKKEWA